MDVNKRANVASDAEVADPDPPENNLNETRLPLPASGLLT